MNKLSAVKITVGVPAYNEEKDIEKVLLAILGQKGNFKIVNIFVFSDCCSDRTEEIVREVGRRHRKIVLISEKKRRGKMVLINKFLSLARTDLVIIANADCLPSKNAIAKLLEKMTIGVGIVGPQGVCILPKKPKLAESISKMLWDWHHQISLDKTKIISFMLANRKAVRQINTLCPVDEPLIEAEANRRGFETAYAPKAKLYIKPPTRLADYISQRRRIHFGYFLMRRYYKNYSPPTMNGKKIIPLFLKQFIKTPFIVTSAAFIELWSKILGWWDFVSGRKNSGIWELALSSKGLKKC